MRAGGRSFRHQHFRAGRARRGMARRGGRGPFAGRGCRHHGRRGPAGLCQRPLSRPAAAPVGAGLGHARRRHRADEGAVRHQARGAARDAGRDRPHLRTGQRRGRGVRLRQPVRDGRGPLPAVVLRHRRFPNNKGVRSPARGALGGGQGPHGRAPERHPDRPLRAGRASRLSDAVQGSLQGRWRRRPRAGGTHQPERHRPLAPAGRDGRVRRQDRRAAAQPGLCDAGVHAARRADSAHADAARFPRAPNGTPCWRAMPRAPKSPKAHSNVHGNERNPGI